jgi:NDP-sugar pyrophosphorylase family protein
LSSEGIQDVVYCIGHLGSLVREYVGDGSAWALNVSYVDEGTQLRGTAGALRLALDQGVLEESFFVVYGDSYLTVNVALVEEAFRSSGCPALMTVYRNAGRWEESNAVFDGHRVRWYQKHTSDPPPDMTYVDYGLLAFHRNAIEAQTVHGQVADLATIMENMSRGGHLAGYEAKGRFYEIGSPDGLHALEAHLAEDAERRLLRSHDVGPKDRHALP